MKMFLGVQVAAAAWLLGLSVTPAFGQNASLIFQDNFETYSTGTYNLGLQKSSGGKWWQIQNSVTAPGCASVTPDQHKVIATDSFDGLKCLRTYYDTMEQWSGGSGCRWRAESAERLTNDGLSTGPVEVWQGYAVKPLYTNNLPWIKRCMGVTGNDLSCVGFRDDLNAHVSQFIGDEDGSKDVIVDIKSDLADTSSARYFNVTNIGRVTDVRWNQWNTIVLHVKTGTAGFVECWINGVYARYDGNLWQASSVYDAKFGIYGDRVDSYATTYLDCANVASGGSDGYNLVNPSPTGSPTSLLAYAGLNWQCGVPSWSQSGTYTATFYSTPSAANIDGVVGLCRGIGTAYTDYACIVRFNTSGRIDARNGGAYQASQVISYQAGKTYKFRLAVNVPNHTYSIYVTPPGGTEKVIGLNYAFRTEQNTRGSLNNWGEAVAGTVGNLYTYGFTVQ